MNAQLHQFGARMNPQQPKADMTQPERVDLEQALAAAATIPLPELPSFLGQLREIEATRWLASTRFKTAVPLLNRINYST
jgi:hypothetical protein